MKVFLDLTIDARILKRHLTNFVTCNKRERVLLQVHVQLNLTFFPSKIPALLGVKKTLAAKLRRNNEKLYTKVTF